MQGGTVADRWSMATTADDELIADPTPVSGLAGAPSERGHFRADIEGLRAVAVVAVVLYHVRLPGFAGGFIGVDVFYVISGFLITGLLRRELLATGRIDLARFYAQRARRLLPAALLVIVITLLASALVLSSIRFPEVAVDGAAAAVYVSNLRFAAGATDYLAAAEAPSPFLHYWSLGVEEQFYLLWPLLVLVGMRLLSIARVAWLVLAIGLVSLAGAIVWTDISAPWAFFSLPTRAWELALGALIALGLLRLPARSPRWLSATTGWLGLGAIVAGVALIDGSTPYPGTAAILPVVGTGLLILAGDRGDVAPSSWLATSLPRWIGRISYSLYLWHWPLLILVPLALDRDDLALRLALAVVAVGLAAASTRFVEAPFRERRVLHLAPGRLLTVAGSASMAVAVVALSVAVLPEARPTTIGVAPGSPGRTVPIPAGATTSATTSPGGTTAPTPTASRTAARSTAPTSPAPPPSPTVPPLPSPVLAGPLPEGLEPPLAAARDDLPRNYVDGCHLDFSTTEPPPCVYGDAASSTTVILFGDSHAAQWLPAFERLATERAWRLVAITKSGCPPVRVTVWIAPLRRAYRECDAWLERAVARVADERPALTVVVAARAYDVMEPDGRRPLSDRPEVWRRALADVLREVAGASQRTVLLADTPRFAADPLECLASHRAVEQCPSPRAQLLEPDYTALEAAAAADAMVGFVSANDWLCPGETCPLVFGTDLVYRDEHHLTARFASILSTSLGASMAPLPGDR